MNYFGCTVSWEQVTRDIQAGDMELSFRQNTHHLCLVWTFVKIEIVKPAGQTQGTKFCGSWWRFCGTAFLHYRGSHQPWKWK